MIGVQRAYRRVVVAAILFLAPSLGAQGTPPATRFNFPDAALADVIRAVAQTAGLSVALADVPDKKISFVTGAIPVSDVGAVLESLLEAHGLVLVKQGAVAQVMPFERAPAAGQVQFGWDMSDPPPLGLVTQMVPLQFIGALEGAEALASIATRTARIEPVPRSNALLITDRGANVARYLQVLRRLDERTTGEAGLRTEVIPLKFASARDLARAIGQLYGVTVANDIGGSLDDRSLNRTLDALRQREADVFRMRRDMPITPPAFNAPGSLSASARTDTASTDTTRMRPGFLVGQTTIVPYAPTNALIVRTAPPNIPLLRETIQALDTRPAQVLFEVTVAEITLGDNMQYGFDWSHVSGSTATTIGDVTNDTASSAGGLVYRFLDLKNTNIRSVLRAIATTSRVRVLSTPEVLATNNREANILVGSKVPFIASSRLASDIAIDRTVQYQDVGTQLTIVPTINDDDYVTVQVLQEVNALTNQIIDAAFKTPVIDTRSASTQAIVKDGETAVIGGLIGDTHETIETGVPLLKDLPILGALFRRREQRVRRTELAIFITPFIIRTDTEAGTIRDGIRRRMNEKIPGAVPDSTANKKKPGS